MSAPDQDSFAAWCGEHLRHGTHDVLRAAKSGGHGTGLVTAAVRAVSVLAAVEKIDADRIRVPGFVHGDPLQGRQAD